MPFFRQPGRPGVTLLLLNFFLLLTAWPAAGELFPLYPIIKNNVAFWEDVYGRYSTTQGILHDQDDLSKVYGVVDLVHWDAPGAAHINKEIIGRARQHYKAILNDLANGKAARSSEEQRIAALFSSRNRHAFLKARDNIRLQVGQKDRFLEGVIRSGAYLPAIRKTLAKYNLPSELAYLPHVESSFNPKAYSKAGASGLWQFTRGTGVQFLTINDEVDERSDPFFSTEAAARFLKENHAQLGTWPLAITAYNHGRAGMVRAVREKGTYENIFKSHQTNLFKFASRNFYSEFLAAMNVARRLEQDPKIIRDQPEATLLLRMAGYVRASDIRTHFRIATEDFARLNPSLREPVLTGAKLIPKGFQVRLPATGSIRELARAFPAGLYHPAQIRDREYIVRRGDTAGAIARKFGLSVKELAGANNLDKRATVKVGQRLKIPGGRQEPAKITSTLRPEKTKQKPN
ncbi:MAG: LysM peptidoglycan-binding domain-containing protein [Desulfobulbus sp.]|nr:MAG: LysM peptidoglycan-binding domain-containing protein [Desulfobulbus sp.]